MSNTNLELKVGAFVLAGLAVIAVMAVQFGRVGQGLAKTWPLTIEFPDAGGLVKNSDVLMAGTKVGRVAEEPVIDNGTIGKVNVQILIREGLKLPKGSRFTVGSAGLLGDKFVTIEPPEGFDAKAFNPDDPAQIIAPGSVLFSSEVSGMDALQKKGEEVADKINQRLDELQSTLAALRNGFLSDANIKNLSDSFADIKKITGNIAESSTKVDGILNSAQATINDAKDAMAGAKNLVGKGETALGDIQSAIGDVRQAVQSTKNLVQTAQTGNGPLPMLLKNRETAENLRALISNLRRHGLLFYRDSAAREQQTPRR